MKEAAKVNVPFWDYIGMKEVQMGDGKSEVRLEIFPDLLQRRGHVHGGVIATLIDASIGSAVRSTLKENEVNATIELKTNYIRPGIGKLLVAKGTVAHRGATLAVGKSEIFDENGKLIAMGSATFMIMDRDR